MEFDVYFRTAQRVLLTNAFGIEQRLQTCNTTALLPYILRGAVLSFAGRIFWVYKAPICNVRALVLQIGFFLPVVDACVTYFERR